MSYDIYTGLLKAFSLPTTVKTDIHFVYENDNPSFIQLRTNYPIASIAGDGGDFSKAINLLHWVSSHIYHKGDFEGRIAYNSLELLNYAYDKGNLCGINCVALATILSECLLAIGLKARRVFLMPCSPYDGDNHVVTHVYISEMEKWVMLDPTLNAYVTNEAGDYLSLLEIRDYLANQKPVFYNTEVNYNGDKLNEESTKFWIEYFAKNLFYFKVSEKSTYGDGKTSENRSIILSPHGYDPKQINLSNIEYRIKMYGASPLAQSWLERTEKEKYNYCSTKDFEKTPNFT
jgi:hypothetical protein